MDVSADAYVSAVHKDDLLVRLFFLYCTDSVLYKCPEA